MKKPELFNESNRATYCMDDNKLRLYVGRVPRDEYEALRAEGWTSTPKQDCDFVSHWTPERRDTCLSYAGIIEDEDMGPEERAADRAERFAGYLGKRTTEAEERADRYDSGPLAHGYQSQARAERAAARHDRLADKAVDAWGKAEYWQRRTAGVIRHALHVCSPSVRMGRIKEIEADIRRIEASYKKAHAEHAARHTVLLSIVEHAEGKREKMIACPGWQYSVEYIRKADNMPEGEKFTTEQMRRCMVYSVFAGEYSGKWGELREKVKAGTIDAVTAAREWLDANGWETPEPFDFTKSDWHQHLTLRLAYENQMLEAQGGRLASVEIEPGGYIGGKLVVKVNKSPVTGRVVSVHLKGPKIQGWVYRAQNVPGTDYALYQFDTERMPMSAYTPPTDETRAELEAVKAEKKAKAPKKEACPIINPTDEDAERLQAIWNKRAEEERKKRNPYGTTPEPKAVTRTTQAAYSEASKGSYARAESRGLCRDCELENEKSDLWTSYRQKRAERIGKPLCKVRITGYSPYSVIILTDKPQKSLPHEVWEALEAQQPTEATA